MIEVTDTSVLILAGRVPAVRMALADALAADEVAISELILLEYLNGARNADEYVEYERALRALRVLPTTPDDWTRVTDVHRRLSERGPGHQRSVKIADLLIAAVAERQGLPIVHYDADYDRIAAVTGQPTRWAIPRGSI